ALLGSPAQATGNGFLYTLAPTITPSLTGTVSKVYDGTNAATLTSANYSLSGAVDGDTVVLNNPTSGTFSQSNVGTNLTVSVSGIAISSATNGPATVYGYQLGSTSASAAVGSITAKPLTATISNQSKTYGTNDPNVSGITVSLSGVVSGDTGNVSASLASLARAAGESVGSYSITGGTLNALSGSSAGNYSASLSTAGNTLAITQKALTAAIADQSKTYGTNDPSLSGITPTLAGVVNTTVTKSEGHTTPLHPPTQTARR